ncbi:MAG: glycosyltransferase family 4 protein [Desulfurococcaceae archaeon]
MSLVMHHYWGSPGGGQLICAAAAKSLDKAGFPPVLSGTFKFDPRNYIEWYGIDITHYPISTLPIEAKIFGLWTRLLVWLPAKRALSKFKNIKIIFTDEVTYKPILKWHYNFKLIEYIHFPFEVSIDPRFKGTGLFYGEDPYITQRYNSFPLNIYWKVYISLLPLFARNNPFEVSDLVLANSRWTARIAKEVYGEEPIVLAPPIAPNVELVNDPKPFEERECRVVMLGRFSQEKRYHWVVTKVLPLLAREVPDVRLTIFGGATTPTLKAYMEKVKGLAMKIGMLKHVEIVPNAPRQLITYGMDSARVFFHATINEHWGIAVAEAMARGLPVVVHKSGGTWSDLTQYGQSGLGYESDEEAVEQIARLLTDKKLWNYYSQASINISNNLVFSKFMTNFMEITRKIV